jgi:hypothetical protein
MPSTRQSTAVGYNKPSFVYVEAGDVIETHEQAGDFKEP